MKKYQYTKTIQFKLDSLGPIIKDIALKPPQDIGENKSKNIQNIINNWEYVLKTFEKLFFDTQKTKSYTENEIKFFKEITFTNLKIKYQWLKSYTKIQFYDWKDKGTGKEYELNKIDYLPEIFKERINEWYGILKELQELNTQPLESQRRRREFAFLLRQLNKQNNLEFLYEFVKAIHNPNRIIFKNNREEIHIDKTLQILKEQIKKVKEDTKNTLRLFLPAQTQGIELIRATFNYYTLNKTPKEYDDEIKKETDKIKQPLDKNLFNRSRKEDNQWEILFNCDNTFFSAIQLFSYMDIENNNHSIDIKICALGEAYIYIKGWKANKKGKFMEAIQKIKSIDELTDEKIKGIEEQHPLFQSEEQPLKDFIRETIEIEKLATIKNSLKNGLYLNKQDKTILEKYSLSKDFQKVQVKITELKKNRGRFFNFQEDKKSNIITKNYYELCEFFKRIVLKYGQALAKIKSLGYEKIDAELVSHWAFILKEENKHKLVVVPREGNKLSELKKYLDDIKECQESENSILYSFESLTLRALEKLCFKENDNTFKKGILKDNTNETKFFYPMYKRQLYYDKYKKALTEEQGDKKLIYFYQKVLKTKYAQNEVAKYSGIQKIIEKDYRNLESSLDKFRKDLERCCYVKRQRAGKDLIDKLKDSYKATIFAIDSLDLRTERNNNDLKQSKEEIGQDTSLMRTIHNEKKQSMSTTLWKQFWAEENTKGYLTRLNPEIKIFWRAERESRIKKYGKNSGNYDLYKKNRFLNPQHTMSATFTLNTGEKDLDFAWNTSLDINKKIEKFNEHYSKNTQGSYLYGIDRGLKELATLCIVKDDETDRPKEFPTITTYTLKEDKYYYQGDATNTRDKSNIPLAKDDKGFGGPIKNISLVADKFENEKWFDKNESKENACLDLTTAKVIRGKIFTNGDLQTFLNLKEISAKRRIFELFHNGEVNKNDEIVKRDNSNII